MKKAQLNDFTVGLIVGIVILLIAGGIGLNIYFKYNQVQDNLKEMEKKINTLKEGESNRQIFALEKNYYLVGFKGTDFKGESNTGENRKITKPDICGGDLCLCYCKESILLGIEPDDCVKRGKCITFENSEYTFLCPECGKDKGLCIKGGEGGLIGIFFKKENKQIYVSTQEDFIPLDQKRIVDSFRATLNTLEVCSKFSGECLCKIDFSFLSPTELLTIKDKELVFSYMNQDYTETSPVSMSLENSKDIELKLTIVRQVESVSDPGLASTSSTYSDSLSLNNTIVSTNLHKVGDKFYFYTPTQNYNSLPECSTPQIVI